MSPPPPPPLPPPNSNVSPTPPLPINVPDPKQKMKTLFWTTVTSVKDKSVWNKIKKMKDKVPVNYPELDKLFFCKDNIPKNTHLSSPKDTQNILDGNKSRNIDFFLVKKSPDQLIEMIRQGSPKEIGLEDYRTLKKNLPSSDEANQLRDVLPEELKKRSKVDYFVYRLISLPQYELLINVMITIGEIDSHSCIPDYFEIITTACDMLMANDSFDSFLRYVLHVGLYMNKGKVAGKAVGFDLCSLQKIAETKSTDDSITLLEFLVQEILKSDSTCLNFVSDFQTTLQKTKSCPLNQPTIDFNTAKQEFSELQAKVDSENCQIKDQCIQLLQTCSLQIKDISEKLESKQRIAQEIADHFSIDNIDIDELLQSCRRLCESIENIQKKKVNTNNSFQPVEDSATMSWQKIQPTSTNVVYTAKDDELSEILANRKIRSDSMS